VPGARTSGEAPVVVVVRIAEGPRTSVTSVDLAGAGAVPKAELEAGLATRAGGPLFGPDVDADRDRILMRYFNRGYLLARVDASVGVSPIAPPRGSASRSRRGRASMSTTSSWWATTGSGRRRSGGKCC